MMSFSETEIEDGKNIEGLSLKIFSVARKRKKNLCRVDDWAIYFNSRR